VTNLNDIEIVRKIKRDLTHARKKIENMKDVEEKKKALKVYAELLTSLEIGASDSPRATG
jgi:5-bromo-4-chloroindolyl phosphate hydrolysis protein